ncbi:MAG: CDP-archaeol synthase [Clostridia bacterium]|nr:CDP-archaeol synthase [Clostridia bacterium]
MLVRTIVGAALVPVMLAILFVCPDWALPCLYALLSVIAQHELLYTTGIVKNRLVIVLCAVVAAVIPFAVYFAWPAASLTGMLLALTVVLFVIAMNTGKTIGFGALAASLFSAFLVPWFFSQAVTIRMSEHGIYLIVLPFLAAWMSDTGAYFSGSLLGKHKLCPNISPKKSVEGAIGGVFGALLGGAIYALVMMKAFDFTVNYLTLAVICALGSVAGQFGDLIFSYIKREFGIKDYGKLFPGHGGVLDRFDSIFLTSPVTAVLLALLPTLLK